MPAQHNHQAGGADEVEDPEYEHREHQLGAHPLQLGAELEAAGSAASSRAEDDPQREVDLVERAELGTVSQVHGIKPVDQLIGHVLAQYLVEAPGQPGSHRHAKLHSVSR